MAITYPVNVEQTRWAVYQVSIGTIVARNKVWPVIDGGPIQGQDPDFIYLLQVDSTIPDYDSRLYNLVGVEVIDVPNNELITNWSTEALPLEEQIVAAENEEASKLSLITKLTREAVETRLIVGAILNYIVDAQQFPPKVQTLADKYIIKAVKVWNNRNRLEEIVDDLNNGLSPDLDAGWEV